MSRSDRGPEACLDCGLSHLSKSSGAGCKADHVGYGHANLGPSQTSYGYVEPGKMTESETRKVDVPSRKFLRPSCVRMVQKRSRCESRTLIHSSPTARRNGNAFFIERSASAWHDTV